MAKRPFKASKMELQLTSMMDVTFQLILFFLLINNMSSAELPKLETPQLIESQARKAEESRRVIVNVIPEGTTGQVKSLRVGITDIAPGAYSQLTNMLKDEKDISDRHNETVEVDLRADFHVHYTNIQPVMQAITAAGIGRVNLVARTKE